MAGFDAPDAADQRRDVTAAGAVPAGQEGCGSRGIGGTQAQGGGEHPDAGGHEEPWAEPRVVRGGPPGRWHGDLHPVAGDRDGDLAFAAWPGWPGRIVPQDLPSSAIAGDAGAGAGRGVAGCGAGVGWRAGGPPVPARGRLCGVPGDAQRRRGGGVHCQAPGVPGSAAAVLTCPAMLAAVPVATTVA